MLAPPSRQDLDSSVCKLDIVQHLPPTASCIPQGLKQFIRKVDEIFIKRRAI